MVTALLQTCEKKKELLLVYFLGTSEFSFPKIHAQKTKKKAAALKSARNKHWNTFSCNLFLIKKNPSK